MSTAIGMARDIRERYHFGDENILKVFIEIPREKFVPPKFRNLVFEDQPVPIGFKQTLSQPITTLVMTKLLDLKGKEKILEIGTGSGFQAAFLSKLAREVYTIERIRELGDLAEKRLLKLGYGSVKVKIGNGAKGWIERSPFDRILITAAVLGKVPQPLFGQLKQGGILVAPVGSGESQIMTRFTKGVFGIKKEEFGRYFFVPFVGS